MNAEQRKQLDSRVGINSNPAALMALVALLGLLLVRCFRPEFWTLKGTILWVLILAGIAMTLGLGEFLLGKYSHGIELEEDLMTALVISPFSLLPLGLWLRYGLSRHVSSRVWPDVRRRLAIFYVVVVAFDLLNVVLFKFWGLIAFFLGAYLIFFGYRQLRREAAANLRISLPYPDAAHSAR